MNTSLSTVMISPLHQRIRRSITDLLETTHKFKLKGTGPLKFLLGCDHKREDDGTMCLAPRRYIEKMIDTNVRLFGEKPKTKFQSPLERNNRPKLDESELLELPQIKIFQSLVGSCQWVIQLGRFDIAVHIMTLSSFRTAPRIGHLTRMKRIYGYPSRNSSKQLFASELTCQISPTLKCWTKTGPIPRMQERKKNNHPTYLRLKANLSDCSHTQMRTSCTTHSVARPSQQFSTSLTRRLVLSIGSAGNNQQLTQ